MPPLVPAAATLDSVLTAARARLGLAAGECGAVEEHAPRAFSIAGESGDDARRQARPERFETRIYALVPAIDLVLGGRGRLAGRIGANLCPVCRERP